MAIKNDNRQLKRYGEKDPWEKELDNFDRVQRRRDASWRRHVVRVNPHLMAQVTDMSGNVHLDKLNLLGSESEF